MVLLGGQDDEVSSYLKQTDVLPLLEAVVEAMLDKCMADPKLASQAGVMLAQWLKDHNPRRDPEMAAKLGSMRAELEAEAAAAAAMYEGAIKVQAGVRGRQARLKAQGKAADAAAVKKLEAEAQAAEEAVTAATKVQAGIRGRQARAKQRAEQPGPPAPGAEEETASAEELEAEAKAAEEAVAAATKVQAGIRGRQARAKTKKA